MSYDVEGVRAGFPALHQEIHGHPLVYLDNAATTQKPQSVIDAVSRYYELDNANVHRGVHELSQRATEAYEGARRKVQGLLGAASDVELIWTRGTTEAINLVAQSYLRPRVGPGEEILVTRMEHHSNIVPWQMVAQQTGATVVAVDLTEEGALDMADFHDKLNDKTALVAVGHVSNALGTVNPVAEITKAAHAHDAAILVDGAQATPHVEVDVQAIGCDFYAVSSHKMYGPTGIGALYGKQELLEAMPPYQGGGDMIASVTFDGTTYNDLPFKFEAGTPNIGGAVGFGAAVDFLQGLGVAAIAEHEHDLLAYATERFTDAIPTGRIIGTAPGKAAVLSFVLDGIHPHDIGTLLDRQGVAVRTGHHCAQPVMQHFGIPATTRASFGAYNTRDDVDRFIAATEQVQAIFG